MRRIFLILALAALSIVAPSAGGASSGTAYTQVTPVLSAQAYCSSATSCSVTLPQAPSIGDTVLCHNFYANPSATTVGGPSGFTAIGTGPKVTGVGVQSYQRVVASGDSHTYIVTDSPAQAILVSCAWFHFAASPGFFSTIGSASSSSSSSLTTSSVAANVPGVLPVEVVAQAATSVAATDVNFSNTVWSSNNASISAQAITLPATGSWPNLSAVTGKPSFAAAHASVAEVLIALPAVSPFTVAVVPAAAATATPTPTGATPTPSPTPTPAAGVPAQRDVSTWMGSTTSDNKNTTSAQVPQWLDWCFGNAPNTNSVKPTACTKSFMYTSLDVGQPDANGNDTSFPWHHSMTSASGKTCPAPATTASNFWKQTGGTYNGNAVPDYTSTGANNWLVWPAGGSTIGTAPGAGVAGYKTSSFFIFLNVFSQGLIDFTNAVIANCNDQYGTLVDSFTGSFEDNVPVGKESLNASIYGGYNTNRNFAPGATTPYNMFTCNGGFQNVFNGTICQPAGATQIESTTMLIPTYPQETSFKTGMAALFQALNHANGSPWPTVYNGWWNTDNTISKLSHVVGAMAEEWDVGGFGACTATDTVTWGGTSGTDATKCITQTAYGYPVSAYSLMNNIAAMYRDDVASGLNPGVEGVLLADEPDHGTYALGTGDEIHDLLWHTGFMLAGVNDNDYRMMNSFMNFCGGGASVEGNSCIDSYTPDYWQPSGRITPWPAEPTGSGGVTPCGNDWHSSNKNGAETGTECVAGGSFDTAISCGSTVHLYCIEWSHFWVFQTGASPCGSFDRRQWSNCAVDIGPAAMIMNSTTSSYTLSTANLSAWLPNTWSSLSAGFVLWPCVPSSAFGSTNAFNVDATARCSGSTGNDVGNGGAFDHSTSVTTIEGKTLLPTDVLILTHL